MSNHIKKIKSLIPYLPDKDIKLGIKFLNERDFSSLKELVDSALYKVKMGLSKEPPDERYLKMDVENLNQLKAEVDVYTMYFDDSIEQEDDFMEGLYL